MHRESLATQLPIRRNLRGEKSQPRPLGSFCTVRGPVCSLLTDSLIWLIALVISRISSATECRFPGWGGTRATQIIDADDVLDRFDGAKSSYGIDPHAVRVLESQSTAL
jgi:hypothetical protein